MCDAFTSVMMENEDLDEKGVKSVLDIFLESGIFGGALAKRLAKQKAGLQDLDAAMDNLDADEGIVSDAGLLDMDRAVGIVRLGL